MRRVVLTILLFLALTVSLAAYSATLANDVCHQKTNYDIPAELSNYETTRGILDFSGKLMAIPYLPVKAASLAVGGGILAEDWHHTDTEIQHREEEILAASFLNNAEQNSAAYEEFKDYLKSSLKEWVPDRDFPQIGYLPKELLLNDCLGEKQITKYWSDASFHDQRKYVALSINDLTLNYRLAWNLLRQGKQLRQPGD